MKVRIPRILAPALTPKRKYEVDESMWIVQFGRPKVMLLYRFALITVTQVDLARKRLQPEVAHGITIMGNSIRGVLSRQGHNTILWFKWGKIPEDWELSFVSRMKLAESQGVSFRDVLKTDLPAIIGDAPSQVLLRWMGRKNLKEPKQFLEAVEEMFGPSSKRIIVGLQDVLDPSKMLEAHEVPEEKFQSLIDAIRRADEEKMLPLQPPEEPQLQ